MEDVVSNFLICCWTIENQWRAEGCGNERAIGVKWRWREEETQTWGREDSQWIFKATSLIVTALIRARGRWPSVTSIRWETSAVVVALVVPRCFLVRVKHRIMCSHRVPETIQPPQILCSVLYTCVYIYIYMYVCVCIVYVLLSGISNSLFVSNVLTRESSSPWQSWNVEQASRPTVQLSHSSSYALVVFVLSKKER